MKIKKLSAWIFLQERLNNVQFACCRIPRILQQMLRYIQAVDLLKESGIGDLLSDPDKVVDIIISGNGFSWTGRCY